jgi:hypothetical protein
MHRGHQREAVFKDDEDRQEFLARLGKACRKTQWFAVAPVLPRRTICNLENLPNGPWPSKTPPGGAGLEFGAVYFPPWDSEDVRLPKALAEAPHYDIRDVRLGLEPG